MIRRAIRSLLNLDDPPERTALAFAVGVFIGFSPLLGLHTILAALIALVWRCNKVAIFTGIYVNNPWTLAPVVAASWAIGRLFINEPHAALPEFSFHAPMSAAFWQMLAAQRRQLLPFAIGAAIAYPLRLHTLRAYRRRQAGAFTPVSGKN